MDLQGKVPRDRGDEVLDEREYVEIGGEEPEDSKCQEESKRRQEMSKRYGWYGMNSMYYVYDHLNHNIPMGHSRGYNTKRAAIAEAEKLNQQLNAKLSPLTMKFDGKTYNLAVTRVRKATAQKEAKKLRRTWGSLARVVREPDGKYSVYSYHTR